MTDATVKRLSTREKVAAAASAAILLATIVYWAIQITDVMESLKLAYG